MASGFFALFDDIATLMDDVATMGKLATKKTVGILGDDLAVNAEKGTGFVSSRELPVIWAITKGSFLNKLIILPLIIGLSSFAPWAVNPILMLGGLYLAFEGAEKIFEYFFHHHNPVEEALETQELYDVDIEATEKKKIKSAILTDFILSLEIIIISLSTVAEKSLTVRIMVLIVIAIITTVGVYGIVALIVRLDDMGVALMRKGEKYKKKSLEKVGSLMVQSLPYVIKILAVVGTLAMLFVAGGIYVHNVHQIHEWLHFLPSFLAEFLVGIIAGIFALLVVNGFKWVKNKFK
jgi:predicted DNA repair protein MutK